MNDSIEFEEDDKRESSGSTWQMGLQNAVSYDTLGSKIFTQQQNLQILYKKEIPSERHKIVATLHEKLSYYRALTSSPSKVQILSMQHVYFNKYLWFYIFNVFCKSLPSTYVYTFLSSYAADEHLFVFKMIPICCGFVWHSIISGYIGIINYTAYVALLWDFLLFGLLDKNPWNRCATYNDSLNLNTTCYTVTDFIKKVQNNTVVFQILGYVIPTDPSSELFQIAPILFFTSRMFLHTFRKSSFWLYQGLAIVLAAILYKQLFKKYIWKILNYTHWALTIMYLVTFCHLVMYYFFNGFKEVPVTYDDLVIQLWNADIDMLAESMTSPPIVHILSSRGTEKVKPSRDSTTIITSNALYYIFKGLLAYLMKRYCETIIGVSLSVTQFNPCSSFYFWPIYLSFFYLGDYYTILYFLLNGITEFLVLAITFNCLVEVISCEWSRLRPWCIACTMCVVTVACTALSSHITYGILYMYMTGISTLAEAIAIFCFYPLGRLVDDITFHCGVPPTMLRLWNLRIVPLYYFFKWITMMDALLDIMHIRHYKIISPTGFIMLYLQVVPFCLGTSYAVFDVIYRKKQNWKKLFIPVSEWGPKDPVVRQLRKQYNSRHYIGSQAPRELSRYFIEKAELTTYRLDIQYDGYSRHSTWFSEARFEDEKKSS